MFASSLQEKNILDSGAKVTSYMTKEGRLLHFFSEEHYLVFGNDIARLLGVMVMSTYSFKNRQHFIEALKRA